MSVQTFIYDETLDSPDDMRDGARMPELRLGNSGSISWVSLRSPLQRRFDKCKATLYFVNVIKSFQHKGLELLYRTGRKSGIQPHQAEKLRLILAAIDEASRPEDLTSPRLGLHKLSGDLAGFWAVKVSGNWRVIFRFEGEDVAAVDYLDYH